LLPGIVGDRDLGMLDVVGEHDRGPERDVRRTRQGRERMSVSKRGESSRSALSKRRALEKGAASPHLASAPCMLDPTICRLEQLAPSNPPAGPALGSLKRFTRAGDAIVDADGSRPAWPARCVARCRARAAACRRSGSGRSEATAHGLLCRGGRLCRLRIIGDRRHAVLAHKTTAPFTRGAAERLDQQSGRG
jgi:hypothetical protein